MRKIIILLGVSILHAHAMQKSENFGQYIGQNARTPAYSNKHEEHVSDAYHYVPVGGVMIKTGMKWQCVEYARRWLIQNQGITFDEVSYAWQIWDLLQGCIVHNGTPVQAQRFVNGQTNCRPQPGDLLVFDTSYAPVTGHVSVVCAVDANRICVAEQNYTNAQWQGTNYSQSYTLSILSSGDAQEEQPVYQILEKGLRGWLRFNIM